MKKVGKTTRPCRNDLSQILYYYTVEMTNRFKGLKMIGRVPENYGQRSLVGYSPWGHKESDTTERLILSDLNGLVVFPIFSISV